MGVKLTVPCGNNAGLWQSPGGGCLPPCVARTFLYCLQGSVTGKRASSFHPPPSSFQTLKINKNMEWEGTEALQW